MGEGFDLLRGIAAELVADHLQLLIEPGGADRRVGGMFLHLADKLAARVLSIGGAAEMANLLRGEGGDVLFGKAKILQAKNLTLVHLDAAGNLVEVFAECDLVQ